MMSSEQTISPERIAFLRGRHERDDWGKPAEDERSSLSVGEVGDLLLALDAATAELSLGHLRIDECADGAATKGQPIRERISAKIQSLVEELTERGHIIAACAAEKDELRARAESAKHREAAAEYRAQRIVLDEELRKRAKTAEAELARLRAQRDEAQLALWTHDGIVIPNECSLVENAADASRARDTMTGHYWVEREARIKAEAECARLRAQKIDQGIRAGRLLGPEFDGASLEDIASEVVRLRAQLAKAPEMWCIACATDHHEQCLGGRCQCAHLVPAPPVASPAEREGE